MSCKPMKDPMIDVVAIDSIAFEGRAVRRRRRRWVSMVPQNYLCVSRRYFFRPPRADACNDTMTTLRVAQRNNEWVKFHWLSRQSRRGLDYDQIHSTPNPREGCVWSG